MFGGGGGSGLALVLPLLFLCWKCSSSCVGLVEVVISDANTKMYPLHLMTSLWGLLVSWSPSTSIPSSSISVVTSVSFPETLVSWRSIEAPCRFRVPSVSVVSVLIALSWLPVLGRFCGIVFATLLALALHMRVSARL